MTPPTTGFEFGDVVLVPFPFTDQRGTKRRPAVVISSASYHRERPDVLILAITSQRLPVGELGEAAVQDWQEAGLLKPSVLKPVITTIEAGLITHRLGRLSVGDQKVLKALLAVAIAD